jgi:PadR family transcriptional regulator PadR
MAGGGKNRNRHSPLTVSMLEPALLVLLKEQPRHGYTLLASLESLGMGTLHPSMVYRTLRQMEELEWIGSDWDTSQTQGPPRRIYSLTPLGEDVLENWQDELEKVSSLISHLTNRLPE